ncbi:unnamed protein product, partial [Prorocentrum cordatum]
QRSPPRGASPLQGSARGRGGPGAAQGAATLAAPRTPRAARSRSPAAARTPRVNSHTPQAARLGPAEARPTEDAQDDPLAEGPAQPAEVRAAAPAVPKLDFSGVLGGAGKGQGKAPPPSGKSKGKGPPFTSPPVSAPASPEASSPSSSGAGTPEAPVALPRRGGKDSPPPPKGKGKGKASLPPPPPPKAQSVPGARPLSSPGSAAQAEAPVALPPRGGKGGPPPPKGGGKGPPPPPPPAHARVAPEAAEAGAPAAVTPRGGKGGPPPPKGKGKGSAANAAPKAKSKPSVPLFGRRLDWQSLSQEKVSGTVFAGFSEEVVGVAEDVTLLKALFEQPKVCSALPNKEATSVKPKCLELLSAKRAQNILIALRRQPLSEQTVGALERLDFEGVGLSPEACQVLMGALPTPEESALLVQHRERASEMRELERTLLPLACLEKPSVTQRLRIVLFARTRVELARDLRSAFRELKGAFKDARASASFRTVLQHTAHLGNVINYGAVKADERVAAGFSLEALPKLCLFKSANDQRITLLHVLVSQVLATRPSLPEALRGELASLRAARRWQLKTLAEDVAMYCKEADHVAAVVGSLEPAEGAELGRGAPTAGAEYGAPRGRAAALAGEAAAEAAALRAELAEVREAARQALAFFAVPAKPAEQDSRALELLGLLDSFRDSFHGCAQELAANTPLAAKVRSPNGSGEPAAPAPAPQTEAPPAPPAEAPPPPSADRCAPACADAQEMAAGAAAPARPDLPPAGGAPADAGRRPSGLEWLGSARRCQARALPLQPPRTATSCVKLPSGGARQRLVGKSGLGKGRGAPLAPEAAAAPVDTKHGAASKGSDAFGFGVDDFSEEMALAKEQPPENACGGSGPVGDAGPAGPAGGAAASPQSQEGRVPGHAELRFGLDDQVLARHAWRARGRALLRCRVAENPQMRFVFCLRCGGILAGRKPGKLLENLCRGRESSAGKEQLRLVRLLRWPHYGKVGQGGALEGPFALGPEEQLQLAGDLQLKGDLPAAASGGRRAAAGDERLPATPADAPGPQGRRPEPRAARLFLLRCYGLTEDDLEEVRRVGREAARTQAADATDIVSEEAELVGAFATARPLTVQR